VRPLDTPVWTDEQVAAFIERLGLPGLVDVHTHFMPEAVMRKVWGWFDSVRGADGRQLWPILYREPQDERVEFLRAMGVTTFTSLFYAHKPGMASWLNAWGAQFAAAVPECVHSATFFPEEGVDAYVAEAVEAGARVFKVHLEVGRFDPRDQLLRPVWKRLEREGCVVVTHAGSGPVPGPFTGPDFFGEVLQHVPELVAVVAHMGAPEYREFLDLALRFPNVHLDTTMTFTDFMERMGSVYPPECLERLSEHPARVVLGSDFPNIPHPYAHQLQALDRLGLGDDWLRAVCYENGARLWRR
jgi:predicted TIM-barrel fold metal-dependent hydrolase